MQPAAVPPESTAAEAGRAPTVPIHPLLAEAFALLDSTGIPWALLRGADDLAGPDGDVDVLVDVAMLPALDATLARAGLHRVVAPGRGSHRFYCAYDAAMDLWLELDVVSAVQFGPYQDLQTSLAAGCLTRRVRERTLWRLAPEDENWLLILHLLLDKGRVCSDRLPAARSAARAATVADPVARALDTIAGMGAAQRVLSCLRSPIPQNSAELAAWLRREWARQYPLRTVGRRYGHRACRRLALRGGGARSGLLVAVMGPDGAGKTTLASAVRAGFPAPTAYVHMGIWRSGRWDRVLPHVPGARLTQRLCRVVSGSSAARYHRRRGRLVLLDRSVYDSQLPGDEDRSFGGRITSAAMMRLAPTPELVLFLDAPGAVMFARKGEHSAAVLERRRRAYLHMAARIDGGTVLDATEAPAEVRRQALERIWPRYLRGGAASAPLPLELWQRLDWRFLLPSPQPGAIVCAGVVDEEFAAALRLLDAELAQVTSPVDWSRVTDSSYDLAVLIEPTRQDLHAAARVVRPGGWVYVQAQRRILGASAAPRSLRGWSRASRRAGLAEVAVHWHAPNTSAPYRLVPLDSRIVVLEALNRYDEVRFGWLLSQLGKFLFACGLLPLAVPGGSVLGRRPW